MRSQTPETQRTFWNDAVGMLGGHRATASALRCSERTVRGLCKGERPLHEGWLRDMSRALLDHAEHCRRLERRLSPDFPSNLIEGQPGEDGRRARWEK